jgi:PAS domain S-box-containing protein
LVPAPVLETLERAATTVRGILFVYDVAARCVIPLGRRVEALLGYSPARVEALGLAGARALIHRDDVARVAASSRRLAAATDHSAIEDWFRVQHADGTWRAFHVRAGILSRDALGMPSAIVGMLLEAPMQRRGHGHAEVLLTLLEHAPECITMIGGPPDFSVIVRSRSAQEMLGRPVSRLFDLPAGDPDRPVPMMRPEAPSTTAPIEETPLYRASRHGETVACEEWIMRRPDDTTTMVEMNAVPIRSRDGAIVGAMSCWRDITERKRMEGDLHDVAERLSLATRAARLCLWEYDVAADVLRLSDECRDLFGWPADREVTRDGFLAAVSADDRARVAQAIEGALKEYAEFDLEYRIVRPDGQERWVAAAGDCFYDELGQPLRFVGTMMDISARKRNEAALRESEERFHALTEAIDEVFWIFDIARGAWLYVSPAYTRLYGRDPSERYNDPDAALRPVHAEDRERVARAYAGLAQGQAFDHEYRIQTPTGVRWVRERSLAAREPTGAVTRVVGITEDITERRIAEQTMHENDRRREESMTQLAHELDAPLSAAARTAQSLGEAIRSNAQLAATERNLAQQVDALTQIARELARAARVGATPSTRLQSVDTRSIVERALIAARPFAQARRQTIAADCADADMPLVGDPAQLTQAIADVIHSALEQTAIGARVAVRARRHNGVALIEASDGNGDAMESTTAAANDHVNGALAAARQVIESHGGRLLAGGNGHANVSVELPLALRAQASRGGGELRVVIN